MKDHGGANDPSAERPGGPPLPEPGPDWTVPQPERLPRPTWAPALMALGIALSFWGVVNTHLVTGVGLLVFAFATGWWIGEMHHGE